MNLDFRKLSMSDQHLAMANLMRIENGSPNFLAYLFANESYDVYGWFSFDQALEGGDYWINLKHQQDADNARSIEEKMLAELKDLTLKQN